MEEKRQPPAITRIDIAERLCRRLEEHATIVENYAYDRDRLVRLDEDRHKLVHGGTWGGLFRRNDEDLQMLLRYWRLFCFLQLQSSRFATTDRHTHNDHEI
jgi:hypothetical protein